MKTALKNIAIIFFFFLIALLFAGGFYVSTAPWLVKAGITIVPLLAAWVLVRAIREAITRRKLGAITLQVPGLVAAGRALPVKLIAHNAALAGEAVGFDLILQRYNGDDWRDTFRARASATFAQGTLAAAAQIAVPNDAPTTTDLMHRWRVEAIVLDHPRAVFEADVSVGPYVEGFGAFDSPLDEPRLASLDLGAGEAPSNAVFDHTSKTWLMSENLMPVRFLGGFFILFGSFWLWQVTRGFSLSSMARFDTASPGDWGVMLFQAPFVVVGFIVLGIGLALVVGKFYCHISAAGITQAISILGWKFRQVRVAPAEIIALRAIMSDPARAQFSMGVMTKDGLLTLPASRDKDGFVADGAALHGHATWLAGVLRRPDLSFDPNPPATPLAPLMPISAGQRNTSAGVSLQNKEPANLFRILAGIIMLVGFVGFALMIAGTFFGTSPSRSTSSNAKQPESAKSQSHKATKPHSP